MGLLENIPRNPHPRAEHIISHDDEIVVANIQETCTSIQHNIRKNTKMLMHLTRLLFTFSPTMQNRRQLLGDY